ncbi:MAG: alpha-isopropylmalate synthase regulatory domain-containing protein [Candidatus Nanoarchaeia archaeon]|nr:alpha-isopropylmalate synthase regulatory domain-containing protein [Candidatus Nanoarchaeia archaeon]
MNLEIYDCTLREGEQAHGASFNFKDRTKLAVKLDEFGIDYIELGWPIVSSEIFDSFRTVIPKMKKAKVVAFGSTSIKESPSDDKNLNSILDCGAKYACIFGKSSLIHVEKQLKITREENLSKIYDSIRFLIDNGIKVFYDAEHYFDSFKNNKEYAIETINRAVSAGAERIILCDTNGGTLPDEAKKIVIETKEVLEKNGFSIELGVHFHDDCGLALANTLSCLPYVTQVQGTINGIGERIGNLNFSEFLPIYIKKIGKNLDVNLEGLKKLNEEAFRLSGIEIPEKRAFVGDLAFGHKAGVHIDAQRKGASYEHESPEDFGNKRTILMNSLGGRSSIINLAEQFGYRLDRENTEVKEKIEELFKELKEYESAGYKLGGIKAEQFLLIEKYFGEFNKLNSQISSEQNKTHNSDDFGKNVLKFDILEWEIKSEFKNRKETSKFKVVCRLGNEIIEGEMSVEGGPVDAAFKTLKKILSKKYPEIEELNIRDFHVSIARQSSEESSVRTRVDFSNGLEFSCVGVDKNMLGSAIEALEKGFRYYLLNRRDNRI